MTATPSIDLPGWMTEQLSQASPDVLRQRPVSRFPHSDKLIAGPPRNGSISANAQVAANAREGQVPTSVPADEGCRMMIKLTEGRPVTSIVTRNSVYCGCERRPVGFVACLLTPGVACWAADRRIPKPCVVGSIPTGAQACEPLRVLASCQIALVSPCTDQRQARGQLGVGNGASTMIAYIYRAIRHHCDFARKDSGLQLLRPVRLR
jgi:hypothetical protein